MITSWSDKEDEALQGLPLEAQILYLRGLRRWMDYATGMVGVQRGISWQMLAEVLYVEPHQGLSGGTPTHSKVRRLMQWLEKQGLVESQSVGTRLIFRLPLADTDESARKKADRKPTGSRQGLADRKPTGLKPSNDAPPKEDASSKADRKPTGYEEQKADTPPVSGIRSITPSLRSGGDAAGSCEPAPDEEDGDRATEFQEACRATWGAYATAYENRYGVRPLRDKKVNGQIKSIVQRLGRVEAPGVAAFFVTHNGKYYVGRAHDVGLLLQDAAKLRTEWATNRQITEAAARQADATATNRESHMGALAILKQKGLT